MNNTDFELRQNIERAARVYLSEMDTIAKQILPILQYRKEVAIRLACLGNENIEAYKAGVEAFKYANTQLKLILGII